MSINIKRSMLMITKIALPIILIAAGALLEAEAKSVGVNFGRLTTHKLLPSMVADICLANGIEKIKLFSANHAVLSAFINSNNEIMVTIPNLELNASKIGGINGATGMDGARTWVQQNVESFILEKNLQIKYLCIATEPFSKIELDKGDTSFIYQLPHYVKNFNIALRERTLGRRVMVTIPHATDILKLVEKPSDGDFHDDIKTIMIEILQNQITEDGPFMINIYPYWSLMEENRSIEFGFFDGKHNESIKDGDLVYTNMFDFKYDTLLWALQKNGFGQMKVIVGQVGWPTDGRTGATVANAKRFHDGLLKKVANKEGTPLQPGVELDVYLYSLVDENQRDVRRGSFERHYGIYTYDGKPKFNIDFTLQGRDIEPHTAQGITYMPQRWCILDKDTAKGKDKLVEENFRKACSNGVDCSFLLENGSSCSGLDYYDKVSYAFNMEFQQSNQDLYGEVQACIYDGLGKIVEKKPETGKCDFPVQILSTLFLYNHSGAEMGKTLSTTSNRQEQLHPTSLIFIFLALHLLCFLFQQLRIGKIVSFFNN